MVRNIGVLAVTVALVSCGGGASPVPGTSLGPLTPPQSKLLLYPGHAPSLVPASEAGTRNASLTFTNSPAPQLNAPLPGGAQYLVYEPNYTGGYTVTNSCSPAAVANTSFETELTPQPGGGYSFKPGPTGSGPGAILVVTASGVLGPQTCTLTVSDTNGNSATIAVTNKQLLLYPASASGFGPGAMGTGFFLDATFVPKSFYVYEQGYSGSYTLAPSSCATFKATLNAPVDPGSPALLSLVANGAPTPEACTFAVSDSAGNQAFVEAYYEGVR